MSHKSDYTRNVWADFEDGRVAEEHCETVIPGIGRCELVMKEHVEDAHGRLVHRVGPVTWNGDDPPVPTHTGVGFIVSDLAVSGGKAYCLPCDAFYDGLCPLHDDVIV